MGRFVQGEDRRQDYLLPASLDGYVSADNPVRAVEAFIDALDLKALEFAGMTPAETGRPAYHPATMLKIYLYGYLNRVQSSRRLEREAQRNVELMWLTGRLAPDFKTIANFRQANGASIRAVCGQFIVLCRQLGLFTRAVVAIDGSKVKAVNNRDRNYTAAKVTSRMKQVQDNIDRYLEALDRADREESDVAEPKAKRLKITLDDVTPAVSRTLEVPLNIRLDRLHTVFQTAFSWTDSHLWERSFGQTGFGIPDPEYGFDGPLDARKATLAQVLADTRRKTFRYLYHFGDAWEHSVKIERVGAASPHLTYPLILDAVGMRPPGLWRTMGLRRKARSAR
jgi:transposase